MFFKKKKEVNIEQQFQDLYKEINKLTQSAANELDYDIKYNHLLLACNKYQDLIKLIDKGAPFEKEHFESLKKTVEKETEKIKRIIDED